MREYLLFQLYGPLASWGSIAVGQERPSDTHPSKSAIIGLLAAAMGVRRDDEAQLQRLAESYGLGVRVDAPGQLLRDYHTAQVPPERRKIRYHTRFDEIHSGDLNTILSGREYRCDALYTVALWVRAGNTPPYSLAALVEGLKRPKFTLYLGRKSCPPAVPVQAQIREAEDLASALGSPEFTADPDLFTATLSSHSTALRKDGGRALIYWDEDAEIGDLKAVQILTRRDHATSRRRWQFSSRREWQGSMPLKDG